ncbi:methyltransferase domain-containing protein [Streptomyces sp. B1866]|uniref:methyltransferase domain-containing protein n=1 Tax=Streptomyces sp. B1866 TaxID=3075431 RepID=UPI00288CB3B9|nr:methyltransferase domain-containing protein [Streptomyces sp. B1866]MDT3400650.1 methyltransferase domain-containing protein [Streptomyces sp. B1866]
MSGLPGACSAASASNVVDGLHRLMDHFGLVFAASDWIVPPEGAWTFIGDLNPQRAVGVTVTTTSPSPHAQALRHRLAEQLARGGYLRDPAWLDAFRAVPREAFLSHFAVPSPDGDHRVWDLGDVAARDDALAAVYTDTPLLTQRDAEGSATSSSTAPSLMALMLEALQVRDGMNVLEIGTGTGYNAALLAHRLGSDRVTSIDVDPGLVDTARRSLERAGYRPAAVCGDGAAGFSPRAPYDRLIATCGVARIPESWLRQVRPGGVILASVGFGLVRLTVSQPGGPASGPFLDYASFTPIRRTTEQVSPTTRDDLALADGNGATRRVPFPGWEVLEERMVVFLRSVAMPGVRQVTLDSRAGKEYVLADHVTGSWARVRQNHEDEAQAVENGPRRLWDELCVVAESWLAAGRPPLASYGLEVGSDGRHELWWESSGGRRVSTFPLPPA